MLVNSIVPELHCCPSKHHAAHMLLLHVQTLHSLSKNRLELLNSMAPYVEEKVLPVLKPVSKCWQPYDMLPKPEDPDFVDQVCSDNLWIACAWLSLCCRNGRYMMCASAKRCLQRLRS